MLKKGYKENISPTDLKQPLYDYITGFGIGQELDRLNFIFLHLNPENNNKVSIPKALNCIFKEDFKDFVSRQNLVPRKAITDIKNTIDEEHIENVSPNIPVIHRFKNKLLQKHSAFYDVFCSLDVDKDGLLSRNDLMTYFKDIIKIEDLEAKTICSYLDSKKEGAINYERFVKKMQKIDHHIAMKEKKRVSNIFGLKQFDSQNHIDNLDNYSNFFDDLRRQYIVKDPTENCIFNRLLRQR